VEVEADNRNTLLKKASVESSLRVSVLTASAINA